ncbi:non-hydrolyzing UDP-N-acetylglucosamine 2-epimerase [Stenotrophomonas sp. UBA7606]|uniref:non-hydrolyzing UDP-N-acetylglucosamine 2-epimerase n=1 Tax=Stenotrophomonas sp. UBA7606 TaxID=1947559 RepID=UPI0025FCD671|nr:UDP-N-acetylglucosamine 2-epimerase (non-hydrolyzing) [Stenotrophomonas sp. UBA7606]
MSTKKQIDLVIGTRPNIIKAAPLYKALAASEWAQPRLVFLQQHTDPALSTQTMEDVGIDIAQISALPLEGHDYGDRFGCMVSRYADLLSTAKPDLVTVFGDVDTTLAAAITAKREQCRLAHVEAGLRSGDRTMPEELNRLMVDSISDLHLTTTNEARETLLREGHRHSSVLFVGNLMIDSLLATVDPSNAQQLLSMLGIRGQQFILATFHRPSNVDSREQLQALIRMLSHLTQRLPVIWPIHPRTRVALQREGLMPHLEIPRLKIIPPLRYRDFVGLQSYARAVVTDSGGIQEECATLGITCLTIRDTTERPDTLSAGNELTTPTLAPERLDDHLRNPNAKHSRTPIPFWDGQAAGRIERAFRNFIKQ